MNETSKRRDIDLRPGMQIKGKWHQHNYVIKKKLGNGAIGSVYLCESNGKYAALKISEKGTSMTVEVNVLKSLNKVQGSRLGPYLLDVDDWVTPQGITYSFYVMEYIQGESIVAFVQRNGPAWIGVFMLQLLEDLEQLHQSGWVFGDLKIENLLVTSNPTRIRLIDVGGTTQIGRAIKEYTEFYDRGYWGLGSRRAEPSYDLFAFVMVFLSIFYRKQFDRTGSADKTICKRINHVKALRPYYAVLKKAILGKYQTSAQMKQELHAAIYHAQKGKKHATGKAPHIVEVVGIALLAGGYYLSGLLIP